MAKREKSIEDIPFRFKVSGNLIKKLGEESITNKNVAILELIKNSYDAKATKVEVSLDNINTKDGKITISDNGEGMTSTDLENKWLNIATPNKANKAVKDGDRVPVGEKGIGRLSSESLGDQTVLITKPKKETAGYKITFDWTKYQSKDALLNEIINPGQKFPKTRIDAGTTLEISKLRHNWNDLEAQKSLLLDLYLLHPPNARPKDFLITTSLPTSGLKKIDKKFLGTSAYYIKVDLVSGNMLKYQAKCITKQTKKGTITLERKLSCGDATFELFYFYRRASALKAALNFQSTSQRVKETNQMLDEYSGIKIYRDGFRVKPYGEAGTDWLELDLGFQNNSMYPRNSNVFGYVSISKLRNPEISDTTTREGIVYTLEFMDLKSFIKTSIQEVFVRFRSELEKHKKKADKKKITKKAKRVKPVGAKPTATKPDKLIDHLSGGRGYPQSFYAKLEDEINECYEKNYPNACFFLSRKLIENLIFNILEKKYPTDIQLWYNVSTNSHLKLSQLIKNLYSKKSDFRPNVATYIEKFNTEIGSFRKEANSKAHNIFEYLSDKSELKKFKINDLTQLLINIYHNS